MKNIKEIIKYHIIRAKVHVKHVYYRFTYAKDGIYHKDDRQKKIIVSLTSYPARMPTLYLCIKSILNQTYKPDKIILYLGQDTRECDINNKLRALCSKGLEIRQNVEDIKPHKKYYFAMKEFPEDIVITVDDDCLYERDMIESLVNSYIKYPKSVSARRVSKIQFSEAGEIKCYNEWIHDYVSEIMPSKSLMAIGVGGVLYPPHCMNEEIFDLDTIKENAINTDDIWLKIMQILNGTSVVWVPCKTPHPTLIERSQVNALYKVNGEVNSRNDNCIQRLMNIYKLSKSSFKD